MVNNMKIEAKQRLVSFDESNEEKIQDQYKMLILNLQEISKHSLQIAQFMESTDKTQMVPEWVSEKLTMSALNLKNVKRWIKVENT